MADMKTKAWHIQNLIEVEPECQVVELCVAEELEAKYADTLEQNKALRRVLSGLIDELSEKHGISSKNMVGASTRYHLEIAEQLLTQTGENND